MARALARVLWQRLKDPPETGSKPFTTAGDQPVKDGAEALPTEAGRCEPTPFGMLTDGDDPFAASVDVVSTLDVRSATEHALALVRWLQGPGGRTGTITARELAELHREMCLDLNWELIGWIPVAREVRALLQARKTYASINGRRVCVYHIPPAHRLSF